MGWLIPEFTKPVTLKLSADDAKREALGRILSLSGAGVGLIGGVMVITANPAARSMFSKAQASTLTMSAQQARKDALGKALALIGTAVGVTGSVLVMTSNPKMKAKFDAQFASLPAALRDNKRALALGALGILAAGTVYMIKAQNKALLTERYAS